MTIEDIDFLGSNSEVDSTLFFLDSDSRDRKAFPTPAEYVIQFSEPIKLVIGVDILDATIPASMYIVDSHSDTLSVSILIAPSDKGGGVEAEELLELALSGSCLLNNAMADPMLQIVYAFLVDEVDLATVTSASVASLATSSRAEVPAFMIVVRSNGGAWVTCTFASAKDLDAVSSNITLLLTIRKVTLILQHGNYDVVTLMLMLSATLKDVSLAGMTAVDTAFGNFEVVSPSSGTISLQGRFAFVNHTTPFLMDMRPASSSAAAVLGFSSSPSLSAAGKGLGYNASSACVSGFGSVLTSTISVSVLSNAAFAASPMQMVVAPGIANLLGVRYITLRCPEIEQHLYSGMTYGSHSTGLGVFKLPSGSEVSNLRFDFVSLVRRPFHPIGRLSRLTLRFERNDGILYDFKGINTQLLLAVKFLSPGKRQSLKHSVLNPDYDPDFLRYTLRMNATEAVESSESNQLGLVPLIPSRPLPFEAHDHEDDAEEGEEEDKQERGGCDDTGERRGEENQVFMRRQEIARKLLQEQDKYDYPSSQYDQTAWRAV